MPGGQRPPNKGDGQELRLATEELELSGLWRRPSPQSTHPIPEKVGRAERAHPWGTGALKPLTALLPEGENQPWEGAWRPRETPSLPLPKRTGWEIKGHRG